MIKKVMICGVLLAAGLSFFSLEDHHSYSNTSGSPGTYTGSPGDGNKTCRSCHSGSTASQKTDAFSSDIPAGGYIPGATYTINVTLTESGRSKFGFECTSENSANQKKGQFINISTSQTRTIGSSAPRITHVNTTATGGTKTWTFKWKAPATGTGNITFYTALNATNSNGSDSGDNIYVNTSTVSEDLTAGIADYLMTLNDKLSLYPNPVTSQLSLGIPSEIGNVDAIGIYDLNGKQLISVDATKTKIDVSALSAGVYLIKVEGESTAVKRFIKQ